MNPASGGELRVVLDTNVYISAFTHPERPMYQIWHQALARRYQLLISRAIVNELADVLRTDFHWEERRLRRRMKLVTRVGELITPRITLNVIPEDPDDDRVLECAVDGRANLIVSGDRHLRRLRVYEGIPIVRPVDFLRTLGVR
jgi:putative PIN family toxin of toxin-antitoxin system